MGEDFNTLDFYKIKVAKVVFWLSLFGCAVALVSSIKTLIAKEYMAASRIGFIIFSILGICELMFLMSIKHKMFASKEAILKYFKTLQWANMIISLINFTFIINLSPNELVWATGVFYLLTITLFQSFTCTGIACVCFAIIIIAFMNMHPVELMQSVDIKIIKQARIQLLQMEITGVLLTSYFSGHILANVGQERMNENTAKLKNVIDKVAKLMGKLENTSSNLICISEEENASMQEIASVTMSIVGEGNAVLEKSAVSKEKLVQLKEQVDCILAEMEQTQKITDDIVEVSESNQEALNNVLQISNTIDESTGNTLEVTKALQGKVEEMGGLIKLIENIAAETNLLALNASIEAARAGEEGRGFSVVAEQVKKLSENTSKSLQNVQDVIESFRVDTKRVEDLMSGNVKEIEAQNKVTHETVEVINQTMKRLKKSAQQVERVKALTSEQHEYTKEIVDFNDEVASCVNDQVNHVGNISELIGQNKTAIEQIVLQVEELNTLVAEIQQVLE